MSSRRWGAGGLGSATVPLLHRAAHCDEDLPEIAGRVRQVVTHQRALRGWTPDHLATNSFHARCWHECEKSFEETAGRYRRCGRDCPPKAHARPAGAANVQVVAVCNSCVESAQKFAKEFDVPEVMDDWAEMLDRPDLDIIWIGTPPVLHAPSPSRRSRRQARLLSGAHGHDLREGREMLVAAQARPNLVTMLCPPRTA